MWETCCAVVGLCMAVYGVLEAVGRIACRVVFGKGDEPPVVVVDPQTGEYRIRQIAAHARYRWCVGTLPLVVLTKNDEPLKRLCTQLGITAYTVEEWHKHLKNRFTTDEEYSIIQK